MPTSREGLLLLLLLLVMEVLDGVCVCTAGQPAGRGGTHHHHFEFFEIEKKTMIYYVLAEVEVEGQATIFKRIDHKLLQRGVQ